ncbi:MULTISPECIES: DedA family protein [unclassified Gilliamella]|uniref:DedA family protein n=1 Tax=unclassified Gilliamella TaxID=2685620 RepID=UPI001C69E4F1|nr:MULTISPECIES: DedA family protein [unclassified Gilliamella]MCX8600543.1 DedA family protein [Gilliamella sp. B3722]MCX8608745.1 DedA family protein [Gilliamella sp. B3771]MCX8609759.1 DedA family protein [Gilliamella sp. B3891]MCX8612151.1 DedA family protein [Gilliamella sp. B3773]MCX8616545.1 DedA family protein [Gilliamella sp. B3770]
MDTIITLYQAFVNMDIATLSNPNVLWILYGMLFIIILLENGVLPAAFLPGDSLLFLTGVLISQNVFHFGLINLILIAGAALGTWLGYIQGLWLGNTKVVQNWMAHIPEKYHKKSEVLFHKYGLQALFIGRFIAFVRTILPMMAGLSGLHSKKFHIYNWISATLWIFLIVTLGYLFGLSPVFKAYEKQIMSLLMLIPVFLLVIGLIFSIALAVKRWLNNKKKAKSIANEASKK